MLSDTSPLSAIVIALVPVALRIVAVLIPSSKVPDALSSIHSSVSPTAYTFLVASTNAVLYLSSSTIV